MISDLLRPESVVVQLESTDKDSLFCELTETLVRIQPSVDRAEVLAELYKREELMNTCVMAGVAVPHANCRSVPQPMLAIGVSRAGIDYELDGVGTKDYAQSFVHVVFFMLFPVTCVERHLKVLADCARLLRMPGFYNALLGAGSASELCRIIREFETSF